ncbi:MAG: hypothetical protein ACYS74_10055 [Planctomycetota bacterium]
MALVYPGSGPSAQMNLMEFKDSFQDDLKQEIKRISRRRLGRDERQHKKYATLKPLGMMEIEWVTHEETTEFHSSSYCFGRHNGTYYLLGIGPGMVEEGLKALSEGEGPDGKIPGVRERAKLALSRWQDQDINPEPILFWAGLARPGPVIALNFFDEDMDVIGFAIEEHYVDANGTRQALVEEYPAFVHFQWPDVGILKIVPMQVRDSGQRADKERWNSYVKAEGIDPNAPMSREYWTATLPPVWVSIPEPNILDVDVYVYDRAGHRSESVELLNPDRK